MNVRRFEHDAWSFASLEGIHPARHAQTPLVAGFQSWEIILRPGRGKVIALRAAEGEELGGRDDANGVQPLVIGTRAAEAVAVKAGHRRVAAGLKGLTKNVAGHGSV